jgi:hypothetical protein
MASTIFLAHKHNNRYLHLSVSADIQEPDEAESVTEEPMEAGESDPTEVK